MNKVALAQIRLTGTTGAELRHRLPPFENCKGWGNLSQTKPKEIKTKGKPAASFSPFTSPDN